MKRVCPVPVAGEQDLSEGCLFMPVVVVEESRNPLHTRIVFGTLKSSRQAMLHAVLRHKKKRKKIPGSYVTSCKSVTTSPVTSASRSLKTSPSDRAPRWIAITHLSWDGRVCSRRASEGAGKVGVEERRSQALILSSGSASSQGLETGHAARVSRNGMMPFRKAPG